MVGLLWPTLKLSEGASYGNFLVPFGRFKELDAQTAQWAQAQHDGMLGRLRQFFGAGAKSSGKAAKPKVVELQLA